MDMDYAIRENELPAINEDSTEEDVALYKEWERSNRLSAMFIKSRLSDSIHGSVEKHTNVRELLRAIDDQFATSDKALASTLLMKFSNMRFTSYKGVREHIMQMRDIVAQLKSLEVEMSDTCLVHFVLNSLPQQYNAFKVAYHTNKDKWSVNELMTMCVQEEARLLAEKGESSNNVHLVTRGKFKANVKHKEKAKLTPHTDIRKENKCFFCKRKGHQKKNCAKYLQWLDRKGIFTSLVCFESHMVEVNHNTWWIDSGSTIHVTNVLQGLRDLRRPEGSEQKIFSGNKISSHVEWIGTCSLVLSTGHVLELKDTFYVPNFSRNLISVSKLVPLGFSF